MSLHPLLDLAADTEVRKASGFRAAAAALTGEDLAARYQQEVANAPRRHDAGKKYFVAYNSRLASERRAGRDGEHLSLALAQHQRSAELPLALPEDGGSIEFLQAQLPLKSAAEDRAMGESDPNRGVGKIDLLGIGPEDRMVVCQVRYLAPSATRGGTGDTPLRAVLEGLAHAAIASANQAAFQQEIEERSGRSMVEEPPILVLLGSPRYWELCRKREAQKGAAWIKEMERLAREIEEHSGVGLLFLGCQLDGDPGWAYPEGSPVLEAAPRLVRAWEHGAGRVRPKPKPRPKTVDPADVPVEADMSLPIRPYGIADSFQAGERIQHPTLGLGVVQGVVGPGKIAVLFDDKRSLLVHERVSSKPAVSNPPPPASPLGPE